ncbi:hypothetical protein CBLAS_0813 [Campylobacter blaseri]|uniref:Pilus assembly protein PilO n=1 Tax=Campylobacter blaseri TaxID=2042961 RepID=A0A2P8R2I4_9BACT|nr:hypothetical protein [Campylobacter blaseri]PSM52699.1 hypothetical protein CQ405_02925 [Campylobacter blaseri]PSM54347.1 hypothetical protein CRN67_02925 [Campylobacter blaseri]QKF86000.1 hypothetical protein CBLAS_0813 [Campylobacter blaseri]
MRKENTLDKIDQYFANKNQNEINMYIAFACLIIFILIYLAIFPMSQEYFDTEERNLNDITSKLNDTNSYLSNKIGPDGDTNYAINKEKNVLDGEINRLNSIKDTNVFFDNKLLEVSSLSNDRKNWAGFLDFLAKNAQENNIKIFYINSQVNNVELKKIQEMLNIDVKLEGAFNNILNYINSIEESEMVVDLNGIDINATKNNLIGGELKISVWGMKYQ